MDDTRDRTVADMNGLGTGVYSILLLLDGVMRSPQEELSALVRDVPGAACKELTNVSVAGFTAPPIGSPDFVDLKSLPTGEVASALCGILMDLELDPSKSVPSPADAATVSFIEKAVADLMGDVRPSPRLVLHAVNVPSPLESDEDKQPVVHQAPAIPAVSVAAGAALSKLGKMPSEANSVSDTRSTQLSEQPSAVASSNRLSRPLLRRVVPMVLITQARVRRLI